MGLASRMGELYGGTDKAKTFCRGGGYSYPLPQLRNTANARHDGPAASPWLTPVPVDSAQRKADNPVPAGQCGNACGVAARIACAGGLYGFGEPVSCKSLTDRGTARE